MTTQLARKKVILAKIEVTYGTDSTPSGGSNAILVTNFQVNPLNIAEVNRDTMHQYLGQDTTVIASVMSEISFDVEFQGSGAAGTAPAWGPLIRACGMGETLVAVTSATYKPISATFESLTFWVYIDGILHKMVGARGTFTLKLKRGAIPYLSFKFTGLYGSTTDVALATPALSAFIAPLAVNKANTTPATIHGFAGVFDEMNFDIGNQITYRNMIGAESVLLSDRKPTGNLVMEAVLVADKDIFGIAKLATLGNISVAHGTAAGKILTVSNTGGTQLLKPTYSEQDGIQMLNVGMKFIPSSSGNDDFQIVNT